MDPAPRDTVEEDRGLAGKVKIFDPVPPEGWEPLSLEDTIKRVPADRVESLAKIQFKDHHRGRPTVTSLNHISGVDEIFSNGPPRDESRLVRVNKGRHERFKPEGEAFCDDFKA